MEPEKDQTYVDFFGQPITEKSKLLVAVSGKLKICSVIKMNRKSIVVTEVAFRNGGPIRTIPENTILLSKEELSFIALREGLRL
jgi:hypothetical protein